jgi:predicted lipoprotein with Yx(FWY)xxD motif
MLGRVHLVVGVLTLALIAPALGGCGSSTKSGSTSASRYTGTIHRGTLTIYTATRTTAEGATETIYIHHDHAVSSADTRHVDARPLPGVGIVLVDGAGHTLYAFVPEANGPSACTGACAKVWPPLRFTIEGTVDASPVLEESLVGAEPDPESHSLGDRVVKVDGHVVHTYIGDTAPGMHNGEGVRSFGGRWYLISPSGKLLAGESH